MCNAWHHAAGCECGFGGVRGASRHCKETSSTVRRSDLVKLKPTVVKTVESGATRIELRDDTLHDDDLVLIHMGAGDMDRSIPHIIDSYDKYRTLESDDGLFCLSVFGVTNGVSKRDILMAFNHGRFGEARYGDIKRFIGLLPTSFHQTDGDAAIEAIQIAHFDLVIKSVDLDGRQDLAELSEEEMLRLADRLKTVLTPVFDAFKPRKIKKEEL